MSQRRRELRAGAGKSCVAVPLDAQDRHLYFVHLNGQRRERVEAVGSLARVELARCSGGAEWKRRVAAVLEEHAGPALMEAVEGFEVRRGELRVEVAEPAARYEVCLCWQQRLLGLLRTHLPGSGITTVRFVSGR